MHPLSFLPVLTRGVPYALLGAVLAMSLQFVVGCGPMAGSSIGKEDAARLAVASCRGLVEAGLARHQASQAGEDEPDVSAGDVAATTATGMICAGSATLAALWWAGIVEVPDVPHTELPNRPPGVPDSPPEESPTRPAPGPTRPAAS